MFKFAFEKAGHGTGPMNWADAFMVSIVALVVAIPSMAVLYVMKSALGINLTDGPSPLHDLLYRFLS